MIVGFTIDDFNGHEQEAVDFINRVCILEDPNIARNIVEAGPGVNIFSKAVTLSELNAQPFSATPIETRDGKYILASAVNFKLELPYNGTTLRLFPTEYIYIDPREVSQFEECLAQKVVAVIPEVTLGGEKWILGEGLWDDSGIWLDSDYWRDKNEQ